jgi:hypothetical protein
VLSQHLHVYHAWWVKDGVHAAVCTTGASGLLHPHAVKTLETVWAVAEGDVFTCSCSLFVQLLLMAYQACCWGQGVRRGCRLVGVMFDHVSKPNSCLGRGGAWRGHCWYHIDLALVAVVIKARTPTITIMLIFCGGHNKPGYSIRGQLRLQAVQA